MKRPAAAASADEEPPANDIEPKKKQKTSSGILLKRPAAAKQCAHGAPSERPSVSVVKTRSVVVARAGLPGEGMTKSVRCEGPPAKAQAEAKVWLRSRCEELGIECMY